MSNSKLWRGLTAVVGVLFAVVLFMAALCNKWSGQINVALGTLPPTLPVTADTAYYGGDYSLDDAGYAQMVADSDASEIATMQEGAVLVKNANNALPLAADERRVTLFGGSVADPIYRGNSGGAQLNASRVVSLEKALTEEGFAINGTLFDAYKNSATKRVKVPVENRAGTKADIGEESSAFYTDALKTSYADDYNDVAIVMFTRDGGEGQDLFYNDAEGISQLALHKAIYSK